MVFDSRVDVMTLLAGYVAVRGVAYVRLFKFSPSDKVTALNLAADDIKIPVKVNDCWYLLETTTVNDRFVPHESIIRIIEVMLLYDPEPNSILTAVTLDIDEQSIFIRTAGTTAAISTEKLL